ncbi:phosphatase PAP2 family protein [Tomitella cavernea]|uniref:Phosphatidic acid phosphatase type 2/haloperoxidase domain-containing protein n=1 Tax=Tomitella cavernea TaxID=1387982 RepID=A0ABP9CKM8_9ACTN|nr:phosphatase PAP2 family protein [Tomitella cavernea]
MPVDTRSICSLPKVRAWPAVALALLAAALVLGVVVTETDALTARDDAISGGLHALDSGWVHTSVSIVAVGFSSVTGLAVLCVWAAALVLRGRRLAALATVLTVSVGWGGVMVLKYVFDRPRPLFDAADGPSYPSGHTALAVSVVFAAFFLARRTDRRDTIATAGVLLVLLVMFARVIAGAHYLTDTVGAVFAASAAIVAFCGVWNAAIPRVLRRHPALAGPGEVVAPRAPRPVPPVPAGTGATHCRPRKVPGGAAPADSEGAAAGAVTQDG